MIRLNEQLEELEIGNLYQFHTLYETSVVQYIYNEVIFDVIEEHDIKSSCVNEFVYLKNDERVIFLGKILENKKIYTYFFFKNQIIKATIDFARVDLEVYLDNNIIIVKIKNT